MPIFHFNVHDGVSRPDPDGHELVSIDAAKREAVDLASQLIREMGAEFWKGDEWRMDVTDPNGMILFQLTFFANLAPTVRPPSANLDLTR